MNKKIYCKLLPLPFIVFWFACTRSDSPQYVARVGDKQISLAEFEARTQTLQRRGYRDLDTLDQSAKMKILEGIIAQELLVMAGLERGLDRDSLIFEEVERTEQRALIDTLYARQAPRDDYTVTEQELQWFFQEKEFDVQVRSEQIVCATEAEAWEALHALQAGESFAALVSRYSMSHIQERFGEEGDIGWFRMNEMLEPLKEPMRTMEVGTIYPRPVESRLGFHVFRLNDRRTVPLEQVRDWAEEQLRFENQMIDRVNYVANLRQRYALEAHGAAINRLLTLPGDQKYWPGEDKPLFTWNDGQLSISYYLAMHRRGRVKHPASLDSAELHQIADNLSGHQIMKTEARRLGYDQDPDIRAAVERRRNELLIRKLLRTKIEQSGIEIGEAEERAYYEENIHEFTRTDGVVTDFSRVQGGIRRRLRQQAENQLMDRFIEELREQYREQIAIYPEILAKAFARQ